MMTLLKQTFQPWFKKNLEKIEKSLEQKLTALANAQGPDIKHLIAAMSHSLLAGGKRLRPLLSLAAARAVGGTESQALPAALAVEMVHTYSLIHDDLPALDNDDIRRGRPACHKAFGEATAILAGDALLTWGFEILSSGKNDETLKAQAILYLAQAIGPCGMVGGQMMDLAFEKQRPSKEMVKEMETLKTGKLISAALVCGAILAGASKEQIKILEKIGLLAGQSFQIKDDLLNQYGDAELMGKATGSDAARGKASFVLMTNKEEAEKTAEKYLSQTQKLCLKLESDNSFLIELLKTVLNRKS